MMISKEKPGPAEPISPARAGKETRTSPAERSGAGTEPRVVKIPVLYDEKTVIALRRLAYVCAQFGNELLSAQYVQAKTNGREPMAEELTPYTDYNDRLSSYGRDAIGREVVGIWRRCGRDILSGKRSLATFSADRALVVRDRGVKVYRREGRYWVSLAPEPAGRGKVELAVSNKRIAMDSFLKILMRRLDEGTYPVTKASVTFKRGKLRLYLTYNRPVNDSVTEGLEAEIGPVEDGICCWVRCAGRSYAITDHLNRIRELKDRYEAIRHRLQIINTNRNRRREWRNRFLNARKFEEAAIGPLHRCAREIADFCYANGARALTWKIEHAGDMPWDRLRQMVEYKCREYGMTFSQTGKEAKQKKGLRKKGDGDGGKGR